ncbi:MAG: protein kinase [Polyangiales bacterium]
MGRSTAAEALPLHGEGSGRYELGAQIAAGGMGAIFRARDRLADREVAYKRLRVPSEAMRARMTALFQREYDTLARLPHPNIVEVHDYGIDAEGPFYAMELLSGADLTKLAPLSYREACRLLRDLASALALLHARRLLHRDVSPNNVRLTSDGRAKLIDFGALTPFGKPRELVGTPAFVAPECLHDDAVLDQRSDLYSLGAVAYWALTRRTAVRARTLDELPAALQEPMVPPSVHVPGIPGALDDLVMSLLAHDPVARPASAAQVIERLTSIADLAPETDERDVAYSYLAHPPLFGRTEILASLQTAVAQGVDLGAKVLLIEGAQGLGRSALLEAVATHAQLAGSTVLRAQGDRAGGPFSLAHRLLELVGVLHPDLDDGLPWLEVPSARGGRTGGEVEAAERHAAMVTRVQEALVALSARGPLVIAVDDVHAADVQSLALLGALVDETMHHPITLVLSALAGEQRTDAPGFATVVAHARGYALAPLEEPEMVALFDALLGGAPNSRRLASWLHEQSGGNPATAMDLARLLLQREVIRYTLGTFTVPHDVTLDLSHADVTNAALARLDGVGPVAHQVADLLALHPGWLSLAHLANASEHAPADVLRALEELLVRGVAAYGREGFRLLGTRLRDALSAALRRNMRCALHVRLASALLDHPDGTLDLRFAAAQHLVRGGEERDAEAIVTEAARSPIGGETAARWVELLERVLFVYRQQKRSKEQCLAVMIPLGLSGFWGSLKTQHHHLDAALTLLSSVCGMTLARKLRPWLGSKLSLMAGLAYATLRRAWLPERERLGTVRSMVADFLALVGTGTAAAASALEGESALRYAALLEPMAAMPPDAPIALARQFSLATAEVGSGNLVAGSARYARLMPHVAAPRPDFDESLRRPMYLGCLNGRAQAEASETSSAALALADELERGDPFFGPHAECARMTYYGHRGEQKKAEAHRARAELLALRGGSSWSAVTVLMVRRACIASVTSDAIGLVQAIAELDRLSSVAPKLGLVKQASEAWLAHLRGHSARAVSLFAENFAQAETRFLPSHAFFRALYASAMNAAGEHARAKVCCAEMLASSQHLPLLARTRLRAESALADAGLGHHAHATHQLDALLAEAAHWDNPLLRGDLHRARARLALLTGDRGAFDAHSAAMSEHFRATENPTLIRQCASLLGEARQAGVVEAAREPSIPPSSVASLVTEDSETAVRTT